MKKQAVDLTDLAIGIIVLGIVVTIGATILLNVRDTNYVLAAGCNDTSGNHTTCDSAWQLADSAASGIAEYGNWFDIIVIVGVAAVILSLIFMAFGRAGSGTSGDTVY
ncbi:hypothetical protein LCGC14_0622380 [marine sediment metagenome]|uniref:Uncharacterized protein n=1 Tax=marine sediment metagenome TaxID=412755 RepID=A0A0F9RNM6_9ZZZZ